MKFFQKKEVTLEKTPILFRLERRHTLLDGADGAKSEDEEGESKRLYRANSVGSYTRPSTPTDTKSDISVTNQCMSNGNRSNYSAASTVVITESELSSSWLYKTRKAKMESTEDTISSNSEIPNDVQDIQPVQLHDPDLKPVPVPSKKRPAKKSSCCCYLLVILIICLTSLGTLAAIGGIIYLEVFAGYKAFKDKHVNHEPSLPNPIILKSKIGQSQLHPNEGWSLNGYRNLVGDSPPLQDFINNIKSNGISSQTDDFLQKTSIDDLDGKGSVSSHVDNLSEDSKEDPAHGVQSNRDVINNEDSLRQGNDVIDDTVLVSGNNHEGNDKTVNSSVLIDLNSGQTVHTRTIDPISNILVSQDRNENKNNFRLADVQDEINADLSGNSISESLDTIIGHQTNSRFPRLEQDILVNESLVINDYEENRLDKNPDISVNEDYDYENGFEIKPENRNLFDDSSLDYNLVMNRPIVEAKPPIDFHKHLINQNKGFDRSSDIEDMDRKFSMSEILKHLRTLEVNNQLPSTRQSQKSVTETMTSSMADQDISSEKKEYLNNLRRKIYI